MTVPGRTVAHVVWGLEVGGLERVVVDLIRGLDPDRFDSIVYCLARRGALADTVADRCRDILVLDKRPGRSYLLPARLGASFRRLGVDIVHAHNFGPLLYGAAGARFARFGRGPAVVYTLHGPEASERNDFRRVDRVRRIDRVVSVSDHVRDVAVHTGGIEAERITTIYNGIDVERFAAGGARDRVRAELGLAEDAVVIGVVARLSAEKDHATLLAAFAPLVRLHPRVRLVLVGDGDLRASLERRAGELEIDRHTLFLGTRTDVPELLSAFDAFAMSSRIEGLGITLIEAMAAGLPTVATAAGGIPEVLTPETGIVVPTGDPGRFTEALAWILDHREDARRMGLAGRERAREHFGVETMVRRYAEVYDEVSS